MTPNERSLLWMTVEQANVIRRLEAAIKLLSPSAGDIVQHEARYQRTLKDTGLEAEAREIEERLKP